MAAPFNFTNAAMPTVFHCEQPMDSEQRAKFAAQIARVAGALGLNAADQNACVRLGLTYLDHGMTQCQACEKAIVLANRLDLFNRLITTFNGEHHARAH